MIVKVSWTSHDRVYTIGISRLFQLLDLDVSDEQIQLAIKKLLEQEEMTREL
jgi:hypothetical protein